jgi:hypothetical protein
MTGRVRSLEGRPWGMSCSVMLPESARLRLLELGPSFVTALAEQRQPMTGLLIPQPRRRWWEALQEFEGAVRLVPRDHDAAKMLHHVRARLNRRSAREREVLHAKGSSLLIATVVVTNSSTGCRSGSPAPRGRSSASSTGRTAVKASSETRC